jgi:hypothetical protein
MTVFLSWDRATWRGVGVAAHLALISLLGLPEAAVRPSDLDKPEVQQWFDRNYAAVSSWLPVSRATFVAGVAGWGQAWMAAREVMLAPSRAYAQAAGTSQHWAMFGSVPQSSATFFVEVKRGGRWERVHQGRFGPARWRPTWFDQERVRSQFNLFVRKKGREDWDRMLVGLAHMAWADFPEATAIRCGMQPLAFPPPEVLARTGALVEGEPFWVTALPRPPSALSNP